MLLPPLQVAELPTFTMSRGAYTFTSRPPRPSSTVSSSSSTSSTSSRACAASLDFPSIQKIIRIVFWSARVTVLQAERLPSRIHQVYLTNLTDGSSLVLKCPPPTNVRLLRHEKHTLESEVKVLDLLHDCPQVPVARVVRYDSHGGQFGSPFLILSHLPGRTLSELSSKLTAVERNSIDRTLGSYVRSLTSLSAPQFGSSHRVFDNRGSKSWREAFLAILEAALRDAEDILVTIPYDSIRFYITKHSHVLDEVVEPRLVALDICRPDNVLLDESSKCVTGILGFSNVLWGDALMNGGLANGSEAFFEGFGQCPARVGGIKIRMLMWVPSFCCFNADDANRVAGTQFIAWF